MAGREAERRVSAPQAAYADGPRAESKGENGWVGNERRNEGRVKERDMVGEACLKLRRDHQ